MSQRYKVRAFESGDQDGVVEAGTVVLPVERSFSVYARGVDEAEHKVKQDVLAGKLAVGRVYQVCPPFGNSESIRSFSVCSEGKCRRTFLDPAAGLYSEFRRIRYSDLRVNPQREEAPLLQEA
jgi:hypothetical protein